MSSCGKAKETCGKKSECKKNTDGTCTFTKKCMIKTDEGEFECECICTCKCNKSDCKNCDCKCQCDPKTAEKIQTAEGIKYRCKCTCVC